MKRLFAAIITIVAVAGTAAGCGIAGGKDIGREAALQAAFDDAGVQESETTRLKVSEDRDDGRKVYEIQFDANSIEYDYEIQASDGAVLSAEREAINTANNAANTETNTDTSTDSTDDTSNSSQGSQDGTGNQYGSQNGSQSGNSGSSPAVSWDEAMQIALDRVPGASEQDVRMELDQDHRECKYEGEIIYNNIEYEFEIDANSGTILEWSEERH